MLQVTPALWVVDGNVEHLPDDYERAISFNRQTKLSFDEDMHKSAFKYLKCENGEYMSSKFVAIPISRWNSSFEWRCRIYFGVATTTLALQLQWLGVEIRISPAYFLNNMRQVDVPLTFKAACPTAWPSISGHPMECF